MKDCHRRTVKFDVGDLGGHLDTAFRGWSSTLAAGFRLVISRLVLIFALGFFMGGWGSLGPCSFLVLFMVLRPLFWHLPACVNCGPLFTRLFGLVVSRWLVGAVLSLMDSPHGCDPACVVWFRFGMFRRYLDPRPSEVGRVYRLLDLDDERPWCSASACCKCC